MRFCRTFCIAGGLWGLVCAGPALAQKAPPPDAAPPPAEAPSPPPGPTTEMMVDLAPNHWAYNAIKVLMERYRVVAGFKDPATNAMSFRGEKTVSRYELAAALAQIMDKIQSRGDERVAPSDRDLVDKLRKEFTGELGQIGAVRAQTEAVRTRTEELAKKGDELAKRTDLIATDVKDLKGWKDAFVLPQLPAEKVKGKLEMTVIDDPGDHLFPFWVASARATLKGKVSENTTASFAFSGGQSAKVTDVAPAIQGSDKPLTPDTKLGASANITTDLKGDLTWSNRFGSFRMDSFLSVGGYADHWWDGIIGNGLAEPTANPTRGGRDLGYATKLKWQGLYVASGVTSQVAVGSLGWDWGWGSLDFIADTDHDSVNLPLCDGADCLAKKLAKQGRDRPFALATGLNLGSATLGVSLRGGIKGAGNFFQPPYQNFGAALLTTNLSALGLPAIELSGGAGYKQHAKSAEAIAIDQLAPAAYVYVPQLHPAVPTLLVGITDIETIGGEKTGAGSLLGDKSGITVQMTYDKPILPNLTLEWNYQQDVLFSDSFDGWGYAVSTGVEF